MRFYALAMDLPTLSVVPEWGVTADDLKEYLKSPLHIRLTPGGGRYGNPGWYLEGAMDDSMAYYEDDWLMYADWNLAEPPDEMLLVAAVFNADPRAGWVRAIQRGFEEAIDDLSKQAESDPAKKHTLQQLRTQRTRILNKLDPDWRAEPQPRRIGSSRSPLRHKVMGKVEIIEGFG